MAKKVDPLNKKQYGAVSAILTVKDVKSAVSFYQKAFGFERRGIMNGPDGKPMHAELSLRGTTLMLGPECAEHGSKGPQSLGGTAVQLYVYVDNADKALAKATKLGGTVKMPVMDMFWGDRCGSVVDPEGHVWMIATHIADYTPPEMNKKMKEQMAQMSQKPAGAATSA